MSRRAAARNIVLNHLNRLIAFTCFILKRSTGMLAESALSLSLSHSSISHFGKQGGVLTPASAMGDVLTERLRRYGLFEIETRSLADWQREREKGKKGL